jgi:hypothetical protein
MLLTFSFQCLSLAIFSSKRKEKKVYEAYDKNQWNYARDLQFCHDGIANKLAQTSG